MAMNNIILGMDLSLSQPGFAVLAITDDGDPLVLEKSFVKTNAKKPHGYRIAEVMDAINALCIRYDPKYIVREKGFSRFPAATQALFKIVGTSDVVAHWHDVEPVHEIAPTSVKKLVTGDGRASKQEVEKTLLTVLQIDDPNYFANDDESDAVATALAFYIREGLVDL